MIEKSPTLHHAVVQAIKQVYDPELPVDIYELGLIYDITIDEKKKYVQIVMTLTSPSCPVADTLPQEVKYKIETLTQAKKVVVTLTFDPPYDIKRLSEEAKLALGIL